MTQYYFDISNGNGFVADEEGQGYATVEQAREQALASIRSIVSDEALAGVVDLSGEVRVRTEDEALFVVPFLAAVRLVLPASSPPR